MATYNASINRDSSDDPLVPTPVSAQIIQELPVASAVLAQAMTVPMSAKTNRQPVLSVLPTAYFVNGDTGLKQTTSQDWENLDLVAEELAVIVPIPEAYLSDAQIPVWDQVRPRIVEAFGKKIDGATLFGVDKPTTWGAPIVGSAVTAGNHTTAGGLDDLAADVAALARLVTQDGFNVNGFISAPGFLWELIGMRTSQGVPIYAPPAGDQPSTLFGRQLNELKNGSFDDHTQLIAGDWTKAVVGLRQDITFRLFTEGVISDDSGNVVLNLMQQDAVALRAVMRLGWAVANPITNLNSNDSTRFPFGVLETSGAS